MQFRSASPKDAPALADLTTQLGYPVTTDEMGERLAAVLAADGALLLAEGGDRVVGWVHVRIVPLLTGSHAEIDGLVVDEAHRGRRIGAALLREAEEWAVERGASRMVVRSNVVREQAHRFYERLGYERFKTSYNLEKRLGPAAGVPVV